VVLRKWLRRSILEGREQLAPLSHPAEGPRNGDKSGPAARKTRP